MVLHAVTDDVQPDLPEHLRRSGDEIIAAEFLATEGALEWCVAVVEDAQDWAVLGLKQWRHLASDQLLTLQAVMQARSLEDVADLPRQHWQRRLTHLGEGMEAARELARRSLLRGLTPLREVWLPFAGMVCRDHRPEESASQQP